MFRLTLGLLALTLVPVHQEPHPLLCVHKDPGNIKANSTSSCKNATGAEDRFCDVTFLYIQHDDGNCFDPKDCNWLFTVKVDNCIPGVKSVKITYFTSTGEKVTCEHPVMQRSAGTLGPASVILDCGDTNSSLFFITFKNANGKKLGGCQPVFQCLQCAAKIPAAE